jgi:hypothetical protein
MTEFNDEIAAIRSHTVSYASDPEFHADWFGLTRRSVNRRALLARRLRDTNGAVAATKFLSLKGRVARALLILAAAFLRGKMSAEY